MQKNASSSSSSSSKREESEAANDDQVGATSLSNRLFPYPKTQPVGLGGIRRQPPRKAIRPNKQRTAPTWVARASQISWKSYENLFIVVAKQADRKHAEVVHRSSSRLHCSIGPVVRYRMILPLEGIMGTGDVAIRKRRQQSRAAAACANCTRSIDESRVILVAKARACLLQRRWQLNTRTDTIICRPHGNP